MNRELPRRLEQNLFLQHIGQETLLYDESRHQAFCLNPVSACIWALCDGAHTVEDMVRTASLTRNAPVTEHVVRLALDGLRRDGLLQPEAGAALLPEVSRRAIMQSLGASAMVLLPVVAMVLAPRAAQAYGGCFDCSNVVGGAKQTEKEKFAARVQALRNARFTSEQSINTQVDGDQ